MELTFIEGWPVRRKSDGREGIVLNSWIQSPGDPDQAHERVFVRDGETFLSGMMGEPATAYESTRVMHAPDIERKAGRTRCAPTATRRYPALTATQTRKT